MDRLDACSHHLRPSRVLMLDIASTNDLVISESHNSGVVHMPNLRLRLDHNGMIGCRMTKSRKAWIVILADANCCGRQMALLFGKCCEVCWWGLDSLIELVSIAALLHCFAIQEFLV